MFNFYTSIKDRRPAQSITLNHFYDLLRSKEQKAIIGKVRSISDKSQRTKEKEKLSAITFNAICGSSKELDSFIDFTGYIFCDVDINEKDTKKKIVTKEQIDALYPKLITNPYVVAIWRSPSGYGYHFLVKVNTTQLTCNKEHFKKRCQELDKNIGDSLLDETCFNITRASYVSFDDSIFINDYPLTFEFKSNIEFDTLLTVATIPLYMNIMGSTVTSVSNNLLTDKEKWNSNIVTITQLPSHIYNGKRYITIDEGHPFADVRFCGKKQLIKGSRTKTIYRMVSNAIYNSPNAIRQDFLSFAQSINVRHCIPQLPYKEVIEQVDHALKNREVPNTKKYVWFNPEFKFAKDEKKDIADGENAMRRIRHSKMKIEKAIEQLKRNNKQLSKSNIKQITNMSYTTINKHLPDQTKTEKAINLIKQAITQLTQSSVSITNRSIHSITKQSLQTIQKYRSIAEKELNESSVSTMCITSVSEKNEVYQESVPSVSYVSGDTLTLGQLVWAPGHTAWGDVAVTIKGELIETTSFVYEEPELSIELMSKYQPKEKLFIRGRWVTIDHSDDCSDLPI